MSHQCELSCWLINHSSSPLQRTGICTSDYTYRARRLKSFHQHHMDFATTNSTTSVTCDCTFKTCLQSLWIFCSFLICAWLPSICVLVTWKYGFPVWLFEQVLLHHLSAICDMLLTKPEITTVISEIGKSTTLPKL